MSEINMHNKTLRMMNNTKKIILTKLKWVFNRPFHNYENASYTNLFIKSVESKAKKFGKDYTRNRLNGKKWLSSNASPEFIFFARRSPVVAISSAGELHDSSHWSITLCDKTIVDNSLRSRQCESAQTSVLVFNTIGRGFIQRVHCRGCRLSQGRTQGESNAKCTAPQNVVIL